MRVNYNLSENLEILSSHLPFNISKGNGEGGFSILGDEGPSGPM